MATLPLAASLDWTTVDQLLVIMRTLQVEDDAHRVLQLVRAQQTLSKARAKRSTSKSSSGKHKLTGETHRSTTRAASPERHRHTHSATKQPAKTLVQAKTQALMAVYGLRTAEPTKDAGSPEFSKSSPSEATRQELLETRRRIYRNHFSGLQATYGPSGRPKLETLIDAAVEAKRSCCKHSSLAIGAAVLTSASRIYASGRLESAQDAKFDVCAERAVLLKVLEHQQQSSSLHQVEVVEAMVICSDQRGLLPMPCGSCREFLAEFGDFPVFLLNAENDSQETRSFELFPHARHSTFTAMAVQSAAQDQPRDQKLKPHKATNDRPMDVRDWSCEQVSAWLSEVVELPQYTGVVLDKRVDGATLWHLQDSDLQLLLGIVQPLHRRRLLVHIDRLKDRELLEHGIDFAQLQDYLAVLDHDRMDVVAQLKATFDRLDQNRDGFLDLAELKSALRELDMDVNNDGTPSASALATDQLLKSLGSVSGSDKVSFPVFVKAFSQLAQLPAGEIRAASAGNATGVPSGVDLVSLRATFDRADTNRSGSIDEQELVGLLQSMGRDNCQARAKEWFQAVDGDGDSRLSFAEFFLRYAQLTKLDLTALRTLFDGDGKGKWRSIQALERALHKLFPHVATTDLKAWCQRRPWLDDAESESGQERKTLTFAEFALACVRYSNTLQLRVAQLRKMQQAMQNDALCHRSRIVHLQQSGHVRLCRHPGGSADEDDTEAERSLGERRRRSQATTAQRSRNNREESKGDDDDEEEEEEEEEAVAAAFRRFAVGKKAKTSQDPRHRREDDDDSKQQSEEEEDEEEEELRLNAVEAAQALMELGIVCSRDQLLRYLDREGFGLRRSLTQREFGRIFKRLKVFQAMPRGLKATEKEAKQRELWAAIGRAASGRLSEKPHETTGKNTARAAQKHANRRDYDEYLRSKHKQQSGRKRDDDDDGGKEDSEDEEAPRRGRRRSAELRRSQSRHRRSSSSSSSSSRRRGRSRSRRASRSRSHRRRDASSTSTASSSSGSSNRSPSRNDHRSRSRTRGEPFFRGFEVGDRVVSSSQGTGTLVRLYRDYFVADVHFDSGDRAKNVDLGHLRRLTATQDKSQRANDKLKRKALVVGAVVRVAHKGTKAAFRRGTILRCRTDGTYDVVANEHGEQELLQRVAFGQIVLVGKPIVYSEGQRVTVKRKHEYLRGCVELCRTNGTYDVRVKSQGATRVLKELAWELLAPDENTGGDEEEEEEEEEEHTPARKKEDDAARRREQRVEEDEDDGKYADDEDGDGFEPEFSKGDHVEARFQGQAAYYGGRITRVHSDGACDVAYDDGDSETRVPSRLIRAVASSKAPTKTTAKTKSSPQDAYEDDFDSD